MLRVNDAFSKVVCISLPERTDRQKATEEELSKYNIDFKFLPANGPITDAERAKYHCNRLLPGETGAFVSHVKALQYGYDSKFDSILIMEDDIELTDNFAVKFDERIKKVPSDWDVIYFGGNHESEPRDLGNGVLRCRQTFALHCVAYRWSSYETLLSLAYEDYCRVPIDYLYATEHQNLKVYAFSPALAFQRVDYSDIQQEIVDYTILRRGYNAEK